MSMVPMTCPHCTNSDHSMMEWTGRTAGYFKSFSFVYIWLCLVCSREFETYTPPQKGA